MNDDTSYFVFDQDCKDRLSLSLPFSTYIDGGFLNYPVSTPHLMLMYDDGQKWQVTFSQEQTLTIQTKVENVQNGAIFNAVCVFQKDGTARVGIPQKIRDIITVEDFEQDFLQACDMVRRQFDCLQFAITHPERIFKKNERGKHILNKAPKEGDDETLYRKIKAFRSLIMETNANGKGGTHKHEYDVRGHYRHYKNGKTIFVKPYVCCKGRGVKNIHIYEA